MEKERGAKAAGHACISDANAGGSALSRAAAADDFALVHVLGNLPNQTDGHDA